MKTENKMHTLKKVISEVSQYKIYLVLSILCAVVFVVCSLYIPILAGEAIDGIKSAGKVDFDVVRTNIIKIAICMVIAAVSQWTMSIINNKITYNTVRDLRSKAFSKLMKVSVGFVDKNTHGDIISRVISDIDTFSDGLLMGFSQLFTGIATIVGTIIFMLTMSPLITLAVVILTPVSLFAAKFIASRTYSMFKKQSEFRGFQTGFVNEMIQNQKTVKAFSYEIKSQQKFDEINDGLKNASLKATFYSSLTNPVTRFVNSLVYMTVALFGALYVINGGLTVGMLVSFLSYANQYTKPFNEISGVITELQNALACAKRVFELIDEDEFPDNGKLTSENTNGRIEFNNVSFSYSSGKKFIENMSFTAEVGQKIAIVGATGCGKTTLINLLMRFYDVDSGEIKIDGKNIKDFTCENLRKCFGMVLQETWLESGTVRENLMFGKADATDEQIKEAAKLTKSDGFIERLSDGYNTETGENGSLLSEGQKQLLCITRVMLNNPPILILDEATSSVDTLTEEKIQQAFDVLMKGRTSFVVAHRLSTIMNADRILVMDNGRIVESGTHEELLSNGGVYANIFNSQF